MTHQIIVSPPSPQLAPLLAALLVVTSLRGAAAVAGDSFLCDLVTASASPMNQNTYKDTVSRVTLAGRAGGAPPLSR